MDFPLLDLMDEKACYEKRVDWLHPEGLDCPRCGEYEDMVTGFAKCITIPSKASGRECAISSAPSAVSARGISIHRSPIFQWAHNLNLNSLLFAREGQENCPMFRSMLDWLGSKTSVKPYVAGKTKR